jgi:hypothetical protein
MCVLTPNGRECVTEGDVQPGEACTSLLDCVEGSLCVAVAAPIDICVEFCEDDSVCEAPGGLCVVTLQDQNGDPIAGVTLCSENCDLTTNAGCLVSGTSCTIGQEEGGAMRFFTACRGAGLGTQADPCLVNEDCAETFGCFDTGVDTECLAYCKVNAPSCPGGATCLPMQIGGMDVVIGSDQYGACF